VSAVVEPVSQPSGRAVAAATSGYSKARLFYWSVRRELWENRSIYLAPIGIALVMLTGFVVGAVRLSGAMQSLQVLGPEGKGDLLTKPLGITAVPILITAILAAVFYCLDALHGERRDRSILFWKSLPVSDLVTVLSKAVVPLVMLPVIACATIVVLQIVILIVGSVILQASGLDAAALWSGASVFHMWGGIIYDVIGLALWHAPIYAWLLLVSGWAPRATFLWAVLPPLALCLIEHIALGTKFLISLLKYRAFGFEEFGYGGHHHAVADPIGLLSSPGLWSGLVVAALLLAAAVLLRRYRQPI
jgi:ABC-2 type transport system permease protein